MEVGETFIEFCLKILNNLNRINNVNSIGYLLLCGIKLNLSISVEFWNVFKLLVDHISMSNDIFNNFQIDEIVYHQYIFNSVDIS